MTVAAIGARDWCGGLARWAGRLGARARRSGAAEAAVAAFAERLAEARSPAEVRAALGAAARVIAGSRRAVIEPGAKPTGGGPSVPVRLGGRTVGMLRLEFDPGSGGHAPRGGTARRLGALAALAVAAERGLRPAGPGGAVRDPVSGLIGTDVFAAFVAQAAALATRRGEPLAVVLVALEGLDALRAGAGPEFADAALGRAARAAVATLRASDVVARLQGDRLAALLPGAGSADAPRVAAALRRALAEALLAPASGPPVAIALGTAALPDETRDPDALLALAAVSLARARAVAKLGGEKAERGAEVGGTTAR